MKEVKYSIVLVNIGLKEYADKLAHWVFEGIKILWFGFADKQNEVEKFLLEHKITNTIVFYNLKDYYDDFVIVDGQMTEQMKKELFVIAAESERAALNKKLSFNVEQYLVEHSIPGKDLIIMAGAGTGKTTVMIDRIMFLMHMIEGLTFSDIAMITFTNEATINMRHKVQKKILSKYRDSRNVKYLEMLEAVTDLNISTIHSFSKNMLSEMGAVYGYSNKMSLRGFTYEKIQIIRDLLNEFFVKKGTHNVNDTIGAPLYEIEKLIIKYWTEMSNIGLTDDQIENLDWGNINSEEELLVQEAMKYVFAQIESRYSELKQKEDAIEVTDIIRELHRLMEADGRAIKRVRPIQYLFVDEFQDTDNVQIQTIAALRHAFDLRLFVVGDIKQSIYRFRGATDIAFESLKKELKKSYGIDGIIEYELIKNYRTSADIMDKIDVYFSKWQQKQLLTYGNPLIAMETMQGEFYKETLVTNKIDEMNQIKHQTICFIQDALHNIGKDAEKKAYVLTRTNWQLAKIKEWCEEAGIPCNVRKQGGFFQSNAVVDFIDMISAFLYYKEPVYLYNYIQSPYCRLKMEDTYKLLDTLEGDKESVLKCLEEPLLKHTKWNAYLKEIRLKPIMYVIRSIVKDADPVKQYAVQRKQELIALGWERDKANTQVLIDTEQYRLDLDKLMQMVRERFSGDFASLAQIYEFLHLRNRTDKQENQDEVNIAGNESCIYGTTVHGSKGLEFDTVIIPFTNSSYVNEKRTELILETSDRESRIGWYYYTKKNESSISNSNYKAMKNSEHFEVQKEEARLLYVAMTRAIRRLLCIEVQGKKDCWSELLSED